MSILTNFLVDDLEEESSEGGINQSFDNSLTGSHGIYAFCRSFHQVRFFLCPPNVRMKPSWYPKLRPCILRVLHHYLADRPGNLVLLDDYNGDLEPDAVHFTLMSGINFVQSMVDQASELIAKPPTDFVVRFDNLCFVLNVRVVIYSFISGY